MNVLTKKRLRLSIYIGLILSYPLVWYFGWTPSEDQHEPSCMIPKIDPLNNVTMDLIVESEKDLGSPACLNRSETSGIAFRIEEHREAGVALLIRVDPFSPSWGSHYCCYFGFEHRNINPSQYLRSNLDGVQEASNFLRQKLKNSNAAKFKEKLWKGLKINRPVSRRCKSITEMKTKIPSTFDHISVHCLDLSAAAANEDDYTANFVLMRGDTKTNVPSKPLTESQETESLSIILIGLDSVSLVNFQRFMPKTRRYLLDTLGAIEFEGQNALDLKTKENLLPVLTGCKSRPRSPPEGAADVEDCPFIWKRYSEKGYRVFKSEDEFEKFATSYYPLLNVSTSGMDHDWLAYITEIQHVRRDSGHTHGCLEYQWLPKLILDRALQISNYFGPNNRAEPYFHYLWTRTSTRDVLGNVQYLDQPVLSLLKRMDESNLLNYTILIFMSDHGIAHGAYPTTFEGSLESKMPFLYFVFPLWFEEKYTMAIQNMLENVKKLTTSFDLHETLLDLLDVENRISNESLAVRAVKPSKNGGISLFQPISVARSCRGAQIPANLCICAPGILT